MADKIVYFYGANNQRIPILAKDNGDDTYSLGTSIGNVTLSGSDIQIGAIEGKDGATDARWKIKSDGTDNALVVTQNTSPLPTGAATSAKQDTSNAAAGATTDAAVVTDAAGTRNAFLRGMVKLFASVIDLVAGRLNVSLYGSHSTNGDVPLSLSSEGYPSVFVMEGGAINTDTGAQRVSLYGKHDAAGDAPLPLADVTNDEQRPLALIVSAATDSDGFSRKLSVGTKGTGDAFGLSDWLLEGVTIPALFNGTDFDRQRSDGLGRAQVSLGAVLAQDVGTKTADDQGIAATAGLRLVGWGATENAGSPAAASFTLRHGTTNADPRLCPAIKLAAGESASDEFPGDGMQAANGVFLDMLAGSIDLVLYYKVVS